MTEPKRLVVPASVHVEREAAPVQHKQQASVRRVEGIPDPNDIPLSMRVLLMPPAVFITRADVENSARIPALLAVHQAFHGTKDDAAKRYEEALAELNAIPSREPGLL